MNDRINAFLSYGFRPFFLLGSLYAVIAAAPWVARFASPDQQGFIGLPVPSSDWHAHEMLFGFTAAIIAGFFLTAVPSWTNRKPVSGTPLLMLVLVWVLGRMANWLPGIIPDWAAAIVDCAFVPLLVALVIRALVAGWSKRNLIFLPIFAGLFSANVMVHLDRLNIVDDLSTQGHRLALDLTIALIIILGGRVVPAFTTNFLRNSGAEKLPHQSDRMTQLALISAVAMVIVNQVAPDTVLGGIVVAIAAVINGIRLLGWQGHRVLGTPILWILFLGFGFVVLGLAADALATLSDWLPRNAADHLLTIGGIGCMTIGIMTRAGLGHTGRKPHASAIMVGTYAAIGCSAVLRTLAPVLWPESYATAMAIVGSLWMISFATFFVTFWPILTRPRLKQTS